MIAGHAALLAWKSGRPVKLIYDRAEDMAATTKRHPSRTRHRTALDADGRLLAMDIDFAIDGGAYCTLSPVVLSRGTIHAAGPYFCPNVRIRGRAVATNAPPHGAFRGFGAPQSLFALERHMDRVAAAAGLTPGGAPPPQFHRARPDERGRPGDLRAGGHGRAARSRARAVRLPREAGAVRRRSIGPAAARDWLRDVHARRGIHRVGRGSPGLGGRGRRRSLTVASACSPRAPRSARARTPSSRRLPLTPWACRSTAIEVVQPDTAVVPDSGPTVASRTCMVVGKLVEQRGDRIARHAGRGAPARRAVHRRRLHDGLPRRISATSGPLKASRALPPADRAALGRRALPGGRVRHLRVGGVRRGSHRRPDHVRDPRRRFRRGSGSRQGDQPGAGHRPDRRWRRAGDRLGALRAGGVAARAAWSTAR